MKKYLLVALASVTLSGCLGFSSSDNEVVGQVKRVTRQTPIICDDYDAADLSLGVMRNGVGSMSKEDAWFYVPSPVDAGVLAEASKSGAIVKITYNEMRASWCVPMNVVTKVELTP